MAYAAVTSLRGTLHLHFLQSQPLLPLQHKQEIVSLDENLSFLQNVFEESEIAYDNLGMKCLEAEMRDVAFKAEERIEMEWSSIYLTKGWTKASLPRLRGIFNQAVKQTEYLKKKLIKIKSEHQFAKGPSITDVSHLGRMRQRRLLHASTSSQPADPEPKNNISVSKFSKNASIQFDSRMVGCNKEFKTILDKLTQQSAKELQVVSIIGMGGIGKTTLAGKVYKDPSINFYFYKQAWVTVSQEYNKVQLLRCLIDFVGSNDVQHSNSPSILAECLRKSLKDQRYLIVIDDIWSEEAWDDVQRCFPDDNNGSRILLTSRLREVVEYAGSSGNSIINMPFLDPNESWNLYCNVFGKTEFHWVFEEIGRDVVKKCKGLPLAITLVASLLSKTEEKVEMWKNVASVIGDSNEACSSVLSLSYNQLPHHLKACFLYFGVFQEDYEMPVKKLVRLWAAEGFFRAEDHQNMEEVAMDCLQNLIDRSLVFVSKQSYNGKMKTIRIHDLLRDLCLREAQHENLLNVIEYRKFPFFKKKISRRWIRAESTDDIPHLTKWVHKSHSLHGSVSEDGYKSVLRLFSHFKLLRVVDIYIDMTYVAVNMLIIANLIHLRYLDLRCPTSWFTREDIRLELFEHWNLQTFIIHGIDAPMHSFEASGIWKMPLLRTFCIGWIVSLGTSSVIHNNLESISGLDPKLCTEDLFTRIPNLKKLGIDGGYRRNNLDCFYNFVHLRQLEELSIRNWWNLDHIPCSGISWETNFLPNLKKLKLINTDSLSWSDMKLIGMLPNLEVLKLKLAIASQDRMWEPSDEGFGKLKRLVIDDKFLECWNAVGDSFPVLECLELRNCYSLHEIPSGFVDITTLALIKLDWCWDSVLTSAKLIQKKQYNNYGNALVVRSENTRTKRVNKKEEELDVEEESDILVD